ncbi:MAG: hypothetical protein KUL79_08135 [Thauera sp.]|nr:hypothetical protein [Thauera sp.]
MKPGHLLPPDACAAQGGQSTTEFLMLALVLIPLLLGLPLLGKYLDLAHATEQAARYVAFETSITGPARRPPTAEAFAAQVRERIYTTSTAPILSTASSAPATGHPANPLWTDHRGEHLLADPASRIGVDLAARTNAAPASALLAGPHGLDLPAGTEYTGTIQVSARDVPGLAPFDTLGLTIRRHQVLLGHNWAAAGSADYTRRIERAGPFAYPIQPLALIGNTVGRVLPPLVLDEPIEVGRVQAEILPCDRLEQGC